MRSLAMIAGLAAALTAVPMAADAACQKRTTGTVVGALTGGLLGHTVAGRGDRTEGALVGAAAGGLVGNQVSKCRRARVVYRDAAPRRASRASQASYARAPSCRYETRAFYDAYGERVYAPTRVCS